MSDIVFLFMTPGGAAAFCTIMTIFVCSCLSTTSILQKTINPMKIEKTIRDPSEEEQKQQGGLKACIIFCCFFVLYTSIAAAFVFKDDIKKGIKNYKS